MDGAVNGFSISIEAKIYYDIYLYIIIVFILFVYEQIKWMNTALFASSICACALSVITQYVYGQTLFIIWWMVNINTFKFCYEHMRYAIYDIQIQPPTA